MKETCNIYIGGLPWKHGVVHCKNKVEFRHLKWKDLKRCFDHAKKDLHDVIQEHILTALKNYWSTKFSRNTIYNYTSKFNTFKNTSWFEKNLTEKEKIKLKKWIVKQLKNINVSLEEYLSKEDVIWEKIE